MNNKKSSANRLSFFAMTSGLRQGAADGAERVTDLGSQQTHHSDDDDGDEREDNRILDEPLTFFLGREQHKRPSFR